MPADPPPVLAYADTTTPAGVDKLQVVRVHDDVRRIVVPPAFGYHRGVSFEVSPFALRVDRADVFGLTRQAWPRSAVLEVRISSVHHGLVLKLAGRDPLDVRLGPHPAANELVLHELIAALTAVRPGPADQQVRPTDLAAGLPPSASRSTLLAVSGGLLVSAGLAAAAAVVFGRVAVLVGVGLLLASIVPAGLALGTQPKDLWC